MPEYIIKTDSEILAKPKEKVKKEEKEEQQYHTIEGLVKGTKTTTVLPKEEEPEEKGPIVHITGYSLEQIERFLDNFLNGQPISTEKEQKLRSFFERKFTKNVKGIFEIKSKAKTLTSFLKDGKRTRKKGNKKH